MAQEWPGVSGVRMVDRNGGLGGCGARRCVTGRGMSMRVALRLGGFRVVAEEMWERCHGDGHALDRRNVDTCAAMSECPGGREIARGASPRKPEPVVPVPSTQRCAGLFCPLLATLSVADT